MVGAAVLGALAACGAERTQPPAPQAASARQRVVDLSHVVRVDVPYPPGEPLTRIERDAGGRLRMLTLGAHTGTTLQVLGPPDRRGPTLEDLSPSDLLIPAVCLDLRDLAQDRGDYRLSAATIEAWEERHGMIPPGAAVLLATGWDMRWGDPAAYLSLDRNNQPTVPGLAADALALLLGPRQARALGLDTLVADPTIASGAISQNPWLLIENLTNLEQLPPTGATLVLGPLKIQAAMAGPVRALALLQGDR
jgi:kynurenine formamidase